MTICITSDYGQIFGLKWWNSQTQVDLKSGWASPCMSFIISKVLKQEYASYWGGFQVGASATVTYKGLKMFFALGVKRYMKICGVTWILSAYENAIEVRYGATATVVSSTKHLKTT